MPAVARAPDTEDDPTATSVAAPACPACGAHDIRPAMNVRGYAFVRCRECLTLFVPELPERSGVARLYADERYFANPDFAAAEEGGYHGYRDYLADREQIEAKFASILAHVERETGVGRVLDVGAGPGFLLSAARLRGWDAVGVEPNPWAAAYARDELGLDVRTGTLEEAAFEPGSFDAVTLMDVVEHVPEPETMVGRAAALVRENGVVALLTPDAGSPVSRALGRRWPEVQRVPEHLVLFSVSGLAALARRHGLAALGWHPVGKRSTIATLVADVLPIAPPLGRLVQRTVSRTRVAGFAFEFDPRTKFVLYTRRDGSAPEAEPRARRLPKRVDMEASAEEAILEDLELLRGARRLVAWMFEQFETPRGGRVLEVGAGIGTFSERLLDDGAGELLLVEPEPQSAERLEQRFAGDARVRVVRELLPDAPTVAAAVGTFDLVLCQNVLEHIEDDAAAVDAMAAALRPGGRLSLLVPAHPRLYGRLDAGYGHHRRYTRHRVRALVRDAGLELEQLYSFNLLGVLGWLAGNRRKNVRIGGAALGLYDRLVPLWRVIERALRPPVGLSLVAHARKPE
jgi:2-polyprenyl-3-methyl-5-hydroxy-6-metoxy-1,4-benzoquinol methylase